MDLCFCRHYQGDGHPPTNRFCRTCPVADLACTALWRRVIDLARSQNGIPVPLPHTRAVLSPHPANPDFVRLQVNCTWNLPKEDFLHFIATGHAGMGKKERREDPRSSPSMTRQEPYVQAIVELLGGMTIPEIRAVKRMQRGV